MDIEPVSITPKALEEVQNIMDHKGIPADYSLRIGIKGGGCGAMGYVIGFDKPNESDISYTIEQIPVVVDKKHVMYLIGLEVDFVEEADARGFSFNKPETV
ncbi:Fe-S cluster protein [Reichenbachiella sp. 5M10]|uniref:HesB/IscA family protein n=1 Tax=Reichenbachiella sp. 5M10 TaxID=1889772 RepID=UPI000C15CFB3|nr:iron-sulfur cluster assembly accessory protein [Reichenbachiella sp. 5M10]PIB34375.1 Fe-S cluster protein [Reichenbachiella sp. 5M10]